VSVDAFLSRKPQSSPIRMCATSSALSGVQFLPQVRQILVDNQWTSRFKTIDYEKDLPTLAEAFVDGQAHIVRVTCFRQNKSGLVVEAQFLNTTELVLDVGQITTLWNGNTKNLTQSHVERDLRRFSARFLESRLEAIYKAKVGTGRSKQGITKKKIGILVAEMEEDDGIIMQNILRQAAKAGRGYTRLVDAEFFCNFAFGRTGITKRAAIGLALARDAQTGGRFKRWPCIPITSSSESITIVNGGWLVCDRGTRKSSEARKFVEHTHKGLGDRTEADVRILFQMECLAMGEESTSDDDKLDVYQTLELMNLPRTPEGAQAALVRVGQWTERTDGSTVMWSIAVLDAARQLVREQNSILHGRMNLSSLSCITIDEQHATILDDGIGIRKRSSTGRKCLPSVSDFEILIHIADASGVYAQGLQTDESSSEARYILYQAAESRGYSRYDLPFGPIHLLPPALLKRLGMAYGRTSRTVTVWAYIDDKNGRLLDMGIERAFVTPSRSLVFEEASSIMDGTESSERETRAFLLVAERSLLSWLGAKDGTKRQENKKSPGTTRSHALVDAALQLYSHVVIKLAAQNQCKLPEVLGAEFKIGGRVATSPLRRCVDGISQSQLLAACCDHGTKRDTSEIARVSMVLSERRNTLAADVKKRQF